MEIPLTSLDFNHRSCIISLPNASAPESHNHMGILAKFQRKESDLLPVCSERSLFSRELHDFEDQFSVFKVLSKKQLF